MSARARRLRYAAGFLLSSGGVAVSFYAIAAATSGDVSLDLNVLLNGAALALLAWNFKQVSILGSRLAVVEALQRERNATLEIIQKALDRIAAIR